MVGVPQHRGRALEPPRQEVLVRRLAEDAPELTAEVRRGEVRNAGERGDVERLAEAGIDEVLGAQEVPGGREVDHGLELVGEIPRADVPGLEPDEDVLTD